MNFSGENIPWTDNGILLQDIVLESVRDARSFNCKNGLLKNQFVAYATCVEEFKRG